jgi:hypothetical protein
MRKLKMNCDDDQVKLVLANQAELERLIQTIRRWEIRNLEEPLEPPWPDESSDRDTPSWFTQQTAKLIETGDSRWANRRTSSRSTWS